MFKGGCLCGAVRYEVEEFAAPPVHCHCETCRKRQGVAMSTNLPVLVEHFHITKGEEILSSFESSPGKRGYFCKNCGSHLYAEKTDVAAIVLRLGCLDEDTAIPEPQAHIWRSDSANWYDPKVQLKELPKGRRSK